MKGSIGNIIKYGGIIALILIASFMISKFSYSSNIDFSRIRRKLSSAVDHQSNTLEQQADTETITPEDYQKRKEYLESAHVKRYIENATADYYHGSYENALRRLERAKMHDPSDYSIFKLSGQIFFEKNKFRKAFNSWKRAAQISNEDKTINRDIDVLKRLLRYSRNEIDRLQKTINKNPQNRLARARLKELKEQMQD